MEIVKLYILNWLTTQTDLVISLDCNILTHFLFCNSNQRLLSQIYFPQPLLSGYIDHVIDWSDEQCVRDFVTNELQSNS